MLLKKAFIINVRLLNNNVYIVIYNEKSVCFNKLIVMNKVNISEIVVFIQIILFGILMFSACSKQEDINSLGEEKTPLYQNDAFDGQDLELEIVDGIYNMRFSSSINVDNNSEVISKLTVFSKSDTILETIFDFDTSEDHWKLNQASNVIEQAIILKSEGVDENILLDVNEILSRSIGYLFYHSIEVKDKLVLSAINYHKSIVNSVIRAYSEDEPCDCTVHPSFLLNKSFFNCQEEQYFDITWLQTVLDDYVLDNETIDVNTINLREFLSSYEKDYLRFDDYYSFYVDKEDFELFISNITTSSSGDCAWWCPLGCGSDHGCCGNYSGCCLYRHFICYVHDRLCTNCTPEWFCLPGCKPDKPQKQVDYIVIN